MKHATKPKKTVIEWYGWTTGHCNQLSDVPKGATIDAVNGVLCIGTCETCGRPILLSEKYEFDTEGIRRHKKCPRIFVG